MEGQATEIVRGLSLKAEEDARASAVRHHRYQLEARAALIRDAKLAAERAEKERVARREANARARIELLIDGADALERAERTRRYVAAVQQRSDLRPDGKAAAALADSSAWALS